jgi:hypothetical protein
LSILGPVRCRRAYYHCAACGAGLAPWDEAVGLSRRNLTPAAEELTSLGGTLADGFEEAAEEVLPRLANLHLSESTVQRTTEDAGQRLGHQLDQGLRLAPAKPWQWRRDLHGRSCAYVSIDAVSVPQQGPQASAAPSRMPYVAMVYNPVPDLAEAAKAIAQRDGADSAAAQQAAAQAEQAAKVQAEKPGPRPRMQARYLAGLYALTALGLLLRRQASAVDMEAAQQWIALSDGGNGLEDFLRNNFNRTDLVVILDFHHPASKLEELARLMHPNDAEASAAQAEQWCRTMKYQGGQAILDVLHELGPPRRREARALYQELVGYIGNNVGRMDYPYYLCQGWQIGSGPVESACKSVVSARLKLAGMRWGEAGTDNVCHLRALFKSEKSLWDAFWRHNLN